MKDKYAIVGVGQTRLGDLPGVSKLGIVSEAMRNAIVDAGLTNKDVDGIMSHSDSVYTHHTRVGELLGINPRFAETITSGGASQIKQLIWACLAIEHGLAEVVVCGYGETERHRADPRLGASAVGGGAREFGPEFGMFAAPAEHALGAQRYMHEYGVKREQLGEIAVAFREHASRNPHAQMRNPITIEDYMNSRWIVEPFKLLDCCLVTDGAGAFVVTTAERAQNLRHPPVYIQGFGEHNNARGWWADDNFVSMAGAESSARAYAMAGVGPQDMQFAQIYDCFTYVVLCTLEDYGFCKKGEGGAFVEGGTLRLGGRLPTNTSGGQLSEGHVQGMMQVIEAVRQLRHDEYGADRQIKDCDIGIVSGHGGNTVCHATAILHR